MELKHYIGVSNCSEKVVSKEDTATNYGSGSLEVFATPAMISLMENTAMNLVKKYLLDRFTTVGTEISVKHLKATAIGKIVKCKSELIEVDGKKLVFKVDAKDDEGHIGTGTHTRFIVETEKFMSKIK
ncbi:MAG: thioesterase family protein [Saprospiraceae bacterium]|nr:thioesterase family protein [Saprospiraceae bacterium]